MTDRMRAASDQPSTRERDVLSWAALTAALAVTAYAEWQLGAHAGFGPWLAAGIPASLDVYALRAMRVRRDVGVVVSLMIAVNALSHLVTAGLITVSIPLVVAVSAIAPLVFWRVHVLRHDAAAAATSARQEQPPTVASEPRQDERQEAPPEPPPVAKKPPAKSRQKTANSRAKKPASPRHSMNEWVKIGEPVFHAEFARLGRQPTGAEFADALAAAGHGRPSDSTAKNIRTEILDRAELPSLEEQ